MLESLFISCRNSLKAIGLADGETKINNLKVLFINLRLVIKDVASYLASDITSYNRNKILLCTSQIKKLLPLMVNVSLPERKQNNMKVVERYLLERLEWCLCEMAKRPADESSGEMEDCNGQFIRHVDFVLCHVPQYGQPVAANYKCLVDNIVCQALTIAKVSCREDYMEITARCQNVLKECAKLLDGRSSDLDNPSMYKLHADLLTGALESLEVRVNRTVLRLVLQVFADHCGPLKRVVGLCSPGRDPLPSNRFATDLDADIQQLDIHCDRAQLIGAFAVACSEDPKNVVGMRCCLASLESLENNLVPALTALYLDPTSVSKLALAKLLSYHCQHELGLLDSLLDTVIDTDAFCQVAHEDLAALVDELREKITDEKNAEALGRTIVNRANKVLQHVTSNMDKNLHSGSMLQDILYELRMGLRECRAAILLLPQSRQPNVRASIIKRFQLIVTTLNRLSVHLACAGTEHSASLPSVDGEVMLPLSIGDVPIDVTGTSVPGCSAIGGSDWLRMNNFKDVLMKAKDNEDDNDKDVISLEPYISRATEMNMTRTMLYGKTPKTDFTEIEPHITKNDVEEVNPEMCRTLNLDITDILDNLTGLSESQTSTENITNSSISCTATIFNFKDNKTRRVFRVTDILKSYSNQEGMESITLPSKSYCYSLTEGSVGSTMLTSAEVTTPERLQDLMKLNDKIEKLKAKK